jgi:hypothetical protein
VIHVRDTAVTDSAGHSVKQRATSVHPFFTQLWLAKQSNGFLQRRDANPQR